MIKYSTDRRTDRRAKRSTLDDFLQSLEVEYRELQDLRERVKTAEAAARQIKLRGSKTRKPS